MLSWSNASLVLVNAMYKEAAEGLHGSVRNAFSISEVNDGILLQLQLYDAFTTHSELANVLNKQTIFILYKQQWCYERSNMQNAHILYCEKHLF